MEFLIWFLIALPFALDVFAAGLVFGLGGVEQSRWPVVAAGLAALSAVFFALGMIIGESLSGPLGSILMIAAGALLFVLGLRSVLDARRKPEDDAPAEPMTSREVMTKSAVLAVDNLAVGVSFAVLGAPLVMMTGIVAIQCFVASLLGLLAGRKLGARAGETAAILAGLVFVALGGAILYKGLTGR